MSAEIREKPGIVYLVGAGPGDPGLVTLRGVRCLARADVVLYDYLVNSRILQLVPPNAETICLGQHGRTRIWTQAEINARLVELARQGRVVVRLKNGDPAVFARAADETEALQAAGVPFEVVPGVTAGLAAGSYAGIPLTHRRWASAVALVTGHEGDAKEFSSLDFAGLARFPGTLVFYMGVTSAPQWSTALLAAGKPPTTPIQLVRRCTWPDQTVVHCTLGDVADVIQQQRLRPPVVAIVGEVAGLAAQPSWFDQRPLFGKRVVVTRAAGQAADLTDRLEELGADVLVQPAIEIGPPDSWQPVDEVLRRLGEFDWLVFSSTNGVRCFLNRLLESGRDLRCLGGIQLAAIGPGTAQELAGYHLRADRLPESYQAESLAAVLCPDARGKRFLLVRASRGREVLAPSLEAAGAVVEQVVAYRSTDCQDPDPYVAAQLAAGQIAYMTVTSSAIARSLAALFGQDLHKTRLVSISPLTSAALEQCGFTAAVEADHYTMDGLIEALLRDVSAGRSGDRPGQAAT